MPWTAWSSIALSVLAIVLLMRGRSALQGTTLLAAWWWALLALLAIGASEALIGSTDANAARAWAPALRLAAATAALCPTMALLGAKRPQHGAWQLIVLSLWAILSLPAATALAFDAPPQMHLVRRAFLLILALLSLGNYLPTRFALPALLFTGAQLALLAAWLPWGLAEPPAWGPPAALVLVVAALFALERSAVIHRSPPTEGAHSWNALWCDFRDWYGAVWALRVEERINAGARQQNWPVRLTWQGFVASQGDGAIDRDVRAGSAPPRQGPLAEELPRELQATFRSLLRRFVGSDWIRRRQHVD